MKDTVSDLVSPASGAISKNKATPCTPATF